MFTKNVITGAKAAREHREGSVTLLSQQLIDKICEIIRKELARARNQDTNAIIGGVKSVLNREFGTYFVSPESLATYIHKNVFATGILNESYLQLVVKLAIQQLYPQNPESNNPPKPGTGPHSAS